MALVLHAGVPRDDLTPAEHAKPKVPHKEGLACVECGARETSQWRGIGGRYCSAAGCRKLADEERKQAIAGKSLEQLAALEERLEEAERTIEHQAAAIEELTDDVKALRAAEGWPRLMYAVWLMYGKS